MNYGGIGMTNKYLSLFSGIGGFEVGIQNSSKDFECVGYSEIDKYAISIYENHFNHHNFGDITKVDVSELPDFDLLVGGFPCQAFSVAGQQKGFADTRGTLFFDIVRVLTVKKPKYFLLENVRNLLSHDKGNTFATMVKILIGLGYKIRWDVLNSKDFGVPQSRERIYIRGSLDELPNDISLTEDEADNSIKYILNGRQGERILSSDGLTTTLAATGGNQGGRTFVRESKIQKIGNHSASGRGQGGNIYDEEGLSPTLTCQHDYPAKVRIKKVYGSMQAHRAENNGEHSPTLTAMSANITNRPIIQTEYAYRAITPIECERLQGFSTTKKEVEIWLSDQARKNVQYVAEKWRKNQKLVGNVEKDKLQKNVSYVEENLQVKNQKTSKLVLKNVRINYEDKKVQLRNLKKLKSSVKSVERNSGYHLCINQEDFAHLIAGMNIIVEKIIQSGREELVRNEQWQIYQKNGKIVVKLFGDETMLLANFVEEDTTIMKKLMKFITSDLSNIKIQDMMLTILYCYVIGVIIGCIPIKTDLTYLEKINLITTTGWTEYGWNGEIISNTQRYKCLGNAVTTNVIQYIIDNWNIR